MKYRLISMPPVIVDAGEIRIAIEDVSFTSEL